MVTKACTKYTMIRFVDFVQTFVCAKAGGPDFVVNFKAAQNYPAGIYLLRLDRKAVMTVVRL